MHATGEAINPALDGAPHKEIALSRLPSRSVSELRDEGDGVRTNFKDTGKSGDVDALFFCST